MVDVLLKWFNTGKVPICVLPGSQLRVLARASIVPKVYLADTIVSLAWHPAMV